MHCGNVCSTDISTSFATNFCVLNTCRRFIVLLVDYTYAGPWASMSCPETTLDFTPWSSPQFAVIYTLRTSTAFIWNTWVVDIPPRSRVVLATALHKSQGLIITPLCEKDQTVATPLVMSFRGMECYICLWCDHKWSVSIASMVLYRDQDAGRSHSIETDKISFEKVEHFRFFDQPYESKFYSGGN